MGRTSTLCAAPWRRRVAAVCAALALAGCHRAFHCEDSSECGLDGEHGTCEPNGSCSFPAGDCESGRRYGDHAAKALVGHCVEPGEDTLADAGSIATSDATTSSGEGSTDDGDASTGPPMHFNPCDGLIDSGPVSATHDDQLIRGLRIVADEGPGIRVEGFTGVTIRDCEIHHANGPGIRFSAADDITIENVAIVHAAAPAEGRHLDEDQSSLEGRFSERVRIDNVRARDGASGFDLEGTPAAHLSFVASYDVRGPGAAACVRIAESDDAVLEDFYCENDLVVSRPDDLVEIEHSNDVIVRRGLLDGHNAEYGYGVHFTQISGQHRGGLVQDVDAIRMTNGSFSCFLFGQDITFERTRARENICEITSIPIEGCDIPGPTGGCTPGSGGLSWAGSTNSSNLVILDSTYFDVCSDPVWPTEVFTIGEGDLVEEDFRLRPPVDVELCWE
ncbi:MAG TPA: right-handed parallel beta-helix repeat-containing protein [Nannocystaceae bacterium]|nr:right-handed parallel beta-helix repeat-containing protein [Nannocystaceae bacterium]